ncbi:MAG: DUF3048 domain-containing protein [Candidatus Magasanikbacteria bacterium]
MKKINQKGIYIIAAVFFLAGLALLIIFYSNIFFAKNKVNDDIVNIQENNVTNEVKEVCDFVRLLDGVCVKTQEETNPELVAVMIENHTEARPQSGLAYASVVYEAPVEANYSRFMAIFSKDVDVAKIGPVRSARKYYLDWLREYGKDIMYMHVGGSPEALQIIKTDKNIFDFNEFSKGPYFWRSTDRYAPHNVYTNSENWQIAWEKLGTKENTEFKTWKFESLENCIKEEDNCVNKITVSFLPPTYEAVWNYSSSTKKYLRSQIEGKHRDLDGTVIEADTIIVQKVTSKVLDEVGRLQIDTIGSGEAIIFQNGHILEGTWKKETVTGRTRWLDKSGNEIPLKAGKIWIEVVNERGNVEWGTLPDGGQAGNVE